MTATVVADVYHLLMENINALNDFVVRVSMNTVICGSPDDVSRLLFLLQLDKLALLTFIFACISDSGWKTILVLVAWSLFQYLSNLSDEIHALQVADC